MNRPAPHLAVVDNQPVPAVEIACQLRPEHALAFAQLLKRISFRDLRDLAKSDVEAHEMLDACWTVKEAFRRGGVSPR